MGIGRREFLKFVGMALAGTSIDPRTPVFAHGDYFVNQVLGLGFIKPAGWSIEVFEDFSHMRRRQIYAEPWMESLIDADFHTLVAVVSKYGTKPEPGIVERFTPGVAVHVESAADNEELGGFESLAQSAPGSLARIFEDFEVLDELEELSICQCRAYRFKSKFLSRDREIKPTYVDVVFYMIEHMNGRHYSIQGFDSPYTGEGAQRELDAFFSSIRLV